MFTIALTGGIGSGKSTVSALFQALGAVIIDADAISRALTAQHGEALPQIAAAFGAHLVDANGTLDRIALRQLVFADAQARQRLEAILHPRISAEIRRRVAAVTGPYVIVDIPLLFETGQADLADRILVVDLSEQQQVERVQARSGLDPQEIRRIMDTQVSRSERLRGADDIIDNSGDKVALPAQIQQLHQRYLELAASKARAQTL
ncbi:dephospho-CoA kinase [Thiohalocapsa marina]|uniref:Dephospho-CoA kinase n=1 Tax=Thiohalocapsa marina TaxID=424902 RepID=A0A5M8FQ34_9GAMM|nr:dephospho-CoA kinase [Thiohalocapsa marina]KAA6186899.1 dephospho-CoA kinase [Thiohalocapsa marina]